MEIVNCECCGKIFNHLKGVKICKECDLNIFNSIKSYIENNNNATVYNISEDLKIPVKIVREYIKDDRLILIRSNVLLCKGCFDIIKILLQHMHILTHTNNDINCINNYKYIFHIVPPNIN